MKRFFVTLALSATIAGTGFAMTEGVENEAVKARMMLMDGVKAATGTLGAMAKGEMVFDADKAGGTRGCWDEWIFLLKHAVHLAGC